MICSRLYYFIVLLINITMALHGDKQNIDFDTIEPIPEELRYILKAFVDKNTYRLFFLLRTSGKMTFSKLEAQSGLSPSSLNNSLKTLQESNLVHNYYEKSTEREFSYYAVTDISESIFNSVYDVLNNLLKFKIKKHNPDIKPNRKKIIETFANNVAKGLQQTNSRQNNRLETTRKRGHHGRS